MKRFLSLLNEKGHYKPFLLLMLLALCSGNMFGSTDQTNPTEVKLGEVVTYENTSGAAVWLYYKYTATEDATILVHYLVGGSVSDYPYIYSDADFSTSVTTTKGDYEYAEDATLAYKTKTFDVTAGATYYFSIKLFNSKTSTFYLSAKEEITSVEVTSVSPEENSTISITQGTISVKFNTTVSMGTATLSCENASEIVTANYNSYSLLWTFSVGDVIYDWLKAGTIEANDMLTLTIADVCDSEDDTVIAGDNGTVTLTFLAPALPTTLDEANSTIPAKFLSYWLPGDEDGIMKLAFSADLSTTETPLVTLRFGSTEEEDAMYTENPACTVSGNTITVDFTGSLRLAEQMLPNVDDASAYTTMSIKVSNIYDTYDALIYDPNISGSAGSCNFSLDYEEISANIATEFTPLSGKVLDDDTESVELWIDGASAVSYSGVNLTYTSSNGTVTSTVAKESLTIEENADEAVITIPLTSDAVGGINLTVELADVEFVDGLDHDASFSATYNEFSMEWVTATPTEAIEKYEEDELFQVSSPVASRIGYMAIVFKDETDDEVLRSGYMTYNESTGYWEYSNPRETEFTIGHTYSVTVTARNTSNSYSSNCVTYGDISFNFEGATPGYEYSEYEFVSISPDPDDVTLTSVDENTFTIKFSGPVNVDNEYTFINYGQGITYSFNSVTAVDDDDNDGYATTWTLEVGTWYMEQLGGYTLDLTVVALDAKDRRVKGTYGEDEQTYFAFSYENTIGVPDFTLDPADGSTVESLSTITVSYEGGIDPTWYYGEKYIKVYDAAGDEVAYCSDFEQVADPDDSWGPSIAFVITLSEEITTPGTYTLYIPAQFFTLYGDYDNYTSKETSVTYTIAATEGINRITTDSELSGDIYTISGMKVDNVSKKGIYIIGGKKVVVK